MASIAADAPSAHELGQYRKLYERGMHSIRLELERRRDGEQKLRLRLGAAYDISDEEATALRQWSSTDLEEIRDQYQQQLDEIMGELSRREPVRKTTEIMELTADGHLEDFLRNEALAARTMRQLTP